MFNRIDNARRSYRQHATLTAPPGRIVLMLYDGALAFLDRSRSGFTLKDPAQFNMTVSNNLLRAQDMIRELRQSLDTEKGGELAATLNRLYEYFDRRLQESNLKKDLTAIDEVSRHLTILRDAWDAMIEGLNEVRMAVGSPALPEPVSEQ